jgi:hypothetical protein
MTPQNFTDDKAKKILQRAAEIDRVRSESVSVDTLREAAREAGIAESSFDAAVSEVTTAAPVRKQRFLGERRLAVAAAVLLFMGLFAMFIARATTAPNSTPGPLPADRSAPAPDRSSRTP